MLYEQQGFLTVLGEINIDLGLILWAWVLFSVISTKRKFKPPQSPTEKPPLPRKSCWLLSKLIEHKCTQSRCVLAPMMVQLFTCSRCAVVKSSYISNITAPPGKESAAKEHVIMIGRERPIHSGCSALQDGNPVSPHKFKIRPPLVLITLLLCIIQCNTTFFSNREHNYDQTAWQHHLSIIALFKACDSAQLSILLIFLLLGEDTIGAFSICQSRRTVTWEWLIQNLVRLSWAKLKILESNACWNSETEPILERNSYWNAETEPILEEVIRMGVESSYWTHGWGRLCQLSQMSSPLPCECKCKTQDISKEKVCFDIKVSTQIIIFGMRFVIRSLYLSRCVHLLSLLIDGTLHCHPVALPRATLMALLLECVLQLCSNEPRAINCYFCRPWCFKRLHDSDTTYL